MKEPALMENNLCSLCQELLGKGFFLSSDLEAHLSKCETCQHFKRQLDTLDANVETLLKNQYTNAIRSDRLQEVGLSKEIVEKIISANKSPVDVTFQKGTQSIVQTLQQRAAGVAQGLPPNVLLPQEFLIGQESISLEFTQDPITRDLLIELIGGSYQNRSLITVTILLKTNENIVFSGKEIAAGGAWSLNAKKAKYVCKITISCSDERE